MGSGGANPSVGGLPVPSARGTGRQRHACSWRWPDEPFLSSAAPAAVHASHARDSRAAAGVHACHVRKALRRGEDARPGAGAAPAARAGACGGPGRMGGHLPVRPCPACLRRAAPPVCPPSAPVRAAAASLWPVPAPYRRALPACLGLPACRFPAHGRRLARGAPPSGIGSARRPPEKLIAGDGACLAGSGAAPPGGPSLAGAPGVPRGAGAAPGRCRRRLRRSSAP
jgi:hypothetical protein